MTLHKWGLVFEQVPDEPDTWTIVPDVGLSDHGAHVYGVPFFDTHPTYKGRLRWQVVSGGYIRGIP